MRRIVASEYLTLDGVMEDPGGSEKSLHGGWSSKCWSDEAARFKFDELFASDALLLGRVTYQGFAALWPTQSDASGFSDRMNSIPKYVVSTTLTALEWNNSHLISRNLGQEVQQLKEMPGMDILVTGSGTLLRSLMRLNLVDLYRLIVHPVVLGNGQRLFPKGTPFKAMQLVNSITLTAGLIVLDYQPKA